MGAHKSHEAEDDSQREIAVLSEIKESEKKAEEILEKAKSEQNSIIHQARIVASNILSKKSEDIKKIQEKKVMEFRDKVKLLNEEKLIEGRTLAKQLKSKADRNSGKAVELVMKKFEEMV